MAHNSILVVDDNPSKRREIVQTLDSLALGESIKVQTAQSQSEALQMMAGESFKLLILDMNIPLREGENAEPDGGIQVLNIIQRGQHKVPEHVIGLTGSVENPV